MTLSKSVHFGIDWKTATIYDIDRIDINARLEDERTPLHLAAAYSSDPEIIGALEGICIGTNMQGKVDKELLNKARAYLLTCQRKNITPPEDIVAFAKQAEAEDFSEVIDALIKYFPKMNAPDENGKTPLHYAAWYNNNPKIISALVNDCPFTKIDKQDNEGRTALHYAAQHNTNHEITLALVENNPRPHENKSHLRLSASPDIRDNEDWRPLHHAACYSANPQVIEILLKETSCPQAKNLKGETALDLFRKHNEKLKNDRKLLDKLEDMCSE